MSSSKASSKKGGIPFQNSINDKVKSYTGGKKASEVAGTISDYASKASKIPVIGSLAGPIAQGAAAASSVLDMFGFTRETEQMVPQPFVHRPYSNLANMNANDTSEIAALDVANSVSYDPKIVTGTSEDQTGFASLFQRPTWIHSEVWDTDVDAGDTIFSIPVTPFYVQDATKDSAFILPLAGYVGLPFQHWRGSMTYIVMVPSSMFHRGALQIAYSPNSVVTTSDLTNVTYNRIMEIDSQTLIEIEIGYVSMNPCLDVEIMSSTLPLIRNNNTFNGNLIFTCVTPFTGPTLASSSTNILVFAYTTQMSFGVPKTVEWKPDSVTGIPISTAFWSSFELQGSGVLGDDAQTSEVEKLVPHSPYDCKAVLWGEEVDSVRALMQKFCKLPDEFMNATTVIKGSTGAIPVPHFPVPPVASGQQARSYGNIAINDVFFSFENWYAPLFQGIAGSSRYKVINSYYTDGAPGSVAALSAPSLAISVYPLTGPSFREKLPLPTGYRSDLAPVWVVKRGEAVEVTIPYYGAKKFYYTCAPPYCDPASYLTAERLLDVIQVNKNDTQFADDSTAVNYITVFRAMGPDLRLSQFKGTPYVKYHVGPSTLPIW